MIVDTYSYSNKGARELNEDSYGIFNEDYRFAAVLCDGLGGYGSGEVASKTAVENIINQISKSREIRPEMLVAILKFVNNGLVKMQVDQPKLTGMRTTAVGCVIDGGYLQCFNCGDSRLYYFSNGVIKHITKDHSISQVSVGLGELTFDEIRLDNQRNRLTKALGDATNDEGCSIYEPIKCKVGDAFLLCSDGFWEYVLENEMEIDLSKSSNAEEWVDYMLVRLLLRYTTANDNFTVIGGIIG